MPEVRGSFIDELESKYVYAPGSFSAVPLLLRTRLETGLSAEELPELPETVEGIHRSSTGASRFRSNRENVTEIERQNDEAELSLRRRMIYPKPSVHNAVGHYEEEFRKVKMRFAQHEPFYGNILGECTLYYSYDISTACAFYHMGIESFCVAINPDFLAYFAAHHKYNELLGLFRHEILHIAWLHVSRSETAQKMQVLYNLAADLAINSFISEHHSLIENSPPNCRKLPRGGAVPGEPWDSMEGRPAETPETMSFMKRWKQGLAGERTQEPPKELDDDDAKRIEKMIAEGASPTELTEEQKLHIKNVTSAIEARIQAQERCRKQLSLLIQGFQKGLTTDEYHSLLQDWAVEHPEELAALEQDPIEFDMHEVWYELPEDVRGFIARKVHGMLTRAANKCDNNSGGWGNFPDHMKVKIREACSGAVPWKEVLSAFVGVLNSGARHSTMKKISRRAPYIHPGTRRGRLARVLIAQDQSGSVSDTMTAQIFAVLDDLQKKVTFDWVAFDSHVVESSLVEVRKGSRKQLDREATGGTDFQAVCDFVMRPDNRGRWEGLIFLTDGQCSEPTQRPRMKVAWILPPGCKLNWSEHNDPVIEMSNTYVPGQAIWLRSRARLEPGRFILLDMATFLLLGLLRIIQAAFPWGFRWFFTLFFGGCTFLGTWAVLVLTTGSTGVGLPAFLGIMVGVLSNKVLFERVDDEDDDLEA